MEIGEKIGTGAQADVYLSGDYAVKLYKEGYPKAGVFYEAAVTSAVEETGLPIAKIWEVGSIGNRMAIKMDYIQGKSLNEYILKNHPDSTQYIDTMVNLQLEVFSKKPDLPITMKCKLKDKISGNNQLDEGIKKKLLSRLESLPDGSQLCHGDLHWNNIIKHGSDYYIIDWVDAVSGTPDGDVCRTYMLYYFYWPDIAERYLNCYCEKTGKSRKEVMEWMPVVAAARLQDHNANEKAAIMKFIDEGI